MKKSYHSTVVPIRLASVTRRRLRSSVAGGAAGTAELPNVPASIVASSSTRSASRRLGSAGCRSDEIASAHSVERARDHGARFVGRDAVAFEAGADAERLEPGREPFRRARKRNVQDLRKHRIAIG